MKIILTWVTRSQPSHVFPPKLYIVCSHRELDPHTKRTTRIDILTQINAFNSNSKFTFCIKTGFDGGDVSRLDYRALEIARIYASDIQLG